MLPNINAINVFMYTWWTGCDFDDRSSESFLQLNIPTINGLIVLPLNWKNMCYLVAYLLFAVSCWYWVRMTWCGAFAPYKMLTAYVRVFSNQTFVEIFLWLCAGPYPTCTLLWLTTGFGEWNEEHPFHWTPSNWIFGVVIPAIALTLAIATMLHHHICNWK